MSEEEILEQSLRAVEEGERAIALFGPEFRREELSNIPVQTLLKIYEWHLRSAYR